MIYLREVLQPAGADAVFSVFVFLNLLERQIERVGQRFLGQPQHFSPHGPTVKEIRALAAAADVQSAGQLLPFLVILPAKSRLAFAEMQLILRTIGMTGKIDRDLNSVGTPHMAQFVPLENRQLGFFTVYDGAFDKYIQDFTKNIGPVFDV
jgi:hypothetical protein